MRVFFRRSGRMVLAVLLFAGLNELRPQFCSAQDEATLIERTQTPPPALDDLETDANHDGVPDGWYNARDVRIIALDAGAGRPAIFVPI